MFEENNFFCVLRMSNDVFLSHKTCSCLRVVAVVKCFGALICFYEDVKALRLLYAICDDCGKYLRYIYIWESTFQQWLSRLRLYTLRNCCTLFGILGCVTL